MESIKESMTALNDLFTTKMSEFQHNLHKTASPVSTTSLAAEFNQFKSLILSLMNTLQRQVEFLALELDRQEMRRRRKIVLFHGVPEQKSEDIKTNITGLIGKHLVLPNFSSSSIRTSYRLGRSSDKPRPIVVKFTDVSTRDMVWFAKGKLKGSGITQSEFLTKDRHDAFLEARHRFGVGKCWSRNGWIHIIGPDGSRHQVETKAEVISLSSTNSKSPVDQNTNTKATDKAIVPRAKRLVKK